MVVCLVLRELCGGVGDGWRRRDKIYMSKAMFWVLGWWDYVRGVRR